MIGFIDDHRAVHGVESICKVLPIAPSTYHEHAARRTDPARRQQDLAAINHIATKFFLTTESF